jgi:serine/threonine protein kinase
VNAPILDTSRSGTDELALGMLVEELTAKLHAGERVDVEACVRDHPEYADQIRQLLPALSLLADLGQSAANQAAAFASGVSVPGEIVGTLGDFRLLREVGRGGMGIVYEAEQISLNRRVALKVLPFASTLDPKQLQRFKNEAQAAAYLHHQNIVPVYATGYERAVHFYAMQFIEGQSLAEVIADLRKTGPKPSPPQASAPEANLVNASSPGNVTEIFPGATSCRRASSTTTAPVAALSTEKSTSPAFFRNVGTLGMEAAQALHYSHELGVIHRDIKPGNLLVDVRGNLWITDFGLAQIQGDNKLTMSGDLLGTLRYMSPEQALAKRVVVDHRTDVYSLGATLYELLTLAPVFDGGDRQELLRQIAFEEPKLLRRHNKSIPVELETIVLKALEKNPADRYASAGELAEDLDRFMMDEPIRARRPGLLLRLRKWSRRHQAVVWSAAIIAMILTASLGWIARDWQARRTEAENRVAQALETADRKLREGNPYDPELISAVRQAEAQCIGGVVREELRARVEQVSADLKMLARLDEIRLEQALPDGKWLSNLSGADPAYARAFHDYDIEVDALSIEVAGARIRQRAIGVHLAAALDNWYLARRIRQEKVPQPLRWRHLLRVAQAADPDLWRASLRQALAKGNDGNDEIKKLAATAPITTLAPTTVLAFLQALFAAGARDQADQILRQWHQLYPGDFWINHDLGDHYCFFVKPPQFELGIGFYRAALALRPKTAKLLHHNLYAAYCNWGSALAQKGQLDEAVACYRESIRVGLAENPELYIVHKNLGLALSKQKKYAEAEEAFREAIRLMPDCVAEAADAFTDDKIVPTLDPREQARVRGQALAWLRTALPTWQKAFDNDPDRQGARVFLMMRGWQRQIDVRGPVALASLPEGERQNWQNFWDEVDNLARRAQERSGFVGNWLVLSEPLPFNERDGAKALDVQQISDEALLHPHAGDRIQAGGQSLSWKKHHAKDDVIDFVALYGAPSDLKMTYAVCHVEADGDRTDLVLRVGSDDHAKVSINGKEVYRYFGQRGVGKEDEVRSIALHKGSNIIVFKVFNIGGPWGGHLRFTDKDGRPAKGLRFGLDPN